MSVHPIHRAVRNLLVQPALLLLFLCADLMPATAQVINFPVREMTSVTFTGATLASGSNVLNVAHDLRSSQTASPTAFSNAVKYKSNNTLVKFGIHHEATALPTAPYVYKLVYQLDGSKQLGNSGNTAAPVIDTLVISYNPDSLATLQDLQVKVYPGYYNARLTIINIYDITNLSVTNPPALTFPISTGPVNFFIELGMRYQPFAKTHYLPAQMGLNLSHAYQSATQSLRVNWLPANNPSYLDKVTPAQYELEWTYADDYSVDSSVPLPASAVRYDFRHNATRIITDSLGYSIPVIYPRGYLVYRVRMIRVDSNEYKTPIYGIWSPTTVSGSVSGLVNSYYVDTGHTHDSLNWNYTMHFAESGKYKHVVGYFDGMLKNRQTITRFNSNPKQLLVTENIYDHEGRAAITTLPSVVDSAASANAFSFTYQRGVSISDATNEPYQAADFDLIPPACPDTGLVIPAFTNSSLANRYYSTLNTDTGGMQKFVPQADGYPFVHTQLSPGFSDRVDRAGGAGQQLQISMGHETINEYAGADQPDLNQLFGITAGFKSFYNKTVTTDPNGQLSMSVKDYEGKLMSSSLIATPDTTHTALMINDEVPSPGFFKGDQLANTPQLTVGHQRIYNGNFFMDYNANAKIKYEYLFRPFQVCPAPNYLGLMVGGNYEYTVTDKCGDVMVYRTQTIGTTGVSTSPTVPPAVDSATIFLKQGKYTLDKTLTINTDEIYAAVDSFFTRTPNCLKTEAEFIKEEVERTKFPCPDSLRDPCAALARQMMEELFPVTGKYGTYNRLSGGLIKGDTPSIFEIDRGELGSGLFRYQTQCVRDSLNSLVINKFGKNYINLGLLPVDTFLFVFTGDDRYTIAKALLPLHPEYCRLKGCFVDTFEAKLLAIPDAATAERYGLFSLDSIVHQDLQLREKLLVPAINMVHIADSLKVMISGTIRMDTFAAEMAFCLNDDSLVFGDARRFFHQRIVDLDFPSQGVKDNYFEKLRAFYLNNRNKYKSIAQTGGGNSCLPCDSPERMRLKPPPLVTVTYNTDGSFNYGPDGMLALFSTSMRSALAASLNIPSYSNHPDTVAKYRDTAIAQMRRMDSTLNYIAVDTLLGRLVNCYINPGDRDNLKSALTDLIIKGEVHNGVFLPDQVGKAITDAGLNPDDLCHPYLSSYDYYGLSYGAKGNCASGDFYEAGRNFLNDYKVLIELQSVTAATPRYATIAHGTWDNSNAFAYRVYQQLNGTVGNDIYLKTTYNSTNMRYQLSFYRLGDPNGPDTVQINLRGPGEVTVGVSTYPLLQPEPGGSVHFSNVACFYEDPMAVAEGHIGRFEFRATVDRTESLITTRTEMLGWSNGTVSMNEEGNGNDIASCVPCTQFKKAYEGFATFLTNHNGYAADHPLFNKSLRNYMNYNVKRVFTEEQYSTFLQSCALADFMTIPAYGGYGKATYGNPAEFDLFKQAVYDADSFSVKTIVDYEADGGAIREVVINYNNIPFQLLRKFNTLFEQQYSGRLKETTPGAVIGTLWVPDGSITGHEITSGTALTANAGSAVSVTIANNAYDYTKYELTAAGSPNFVDISTSVAAVQQQLYDQNIQGVWLPTHFATINQDYYNRIKRELLDYTYNLENTIPNASTSDVLDQLQAHLLETNLSSLSGSEASYNDPLNAYKFTNLYYSNPANVLDGYTKLQDVFNYATGFPLIGSPFMAGNQANNTKVTASPAGTSLIQYRCSDGLYWFRFFDTDRKLYNIFVRMPAYIHKNAHSGYRISGIVPNNGDSMTRRFTLHLSNGSDAIEATGSTSFDIGWSQRLSDVLLGNEFDHREIDVVSGEPGARDNCEQILLNNAIYAGKVNYAIYIDSFRSRLKTSFYAHVMSQIQEKLWLEYVDMRFATTLYNYDLAGNLIQTVPPEGVQKLTGAALADVDDKRINNVIDAAVIPAHRKVTRYEYNTANKPLYETTPDAGGKKLYYDIKGNVIASQTARQRAKGSFTYMLYDGQNRVMETGEMLWSTCPGFADYKTHARDGGGNLYKLPPPISSCYCENTRDSLYQYCLDNYIGIFMNDYENTSFASMIRTRPRSQVVVTIYDQTLTDLSAFTGMSRQENLRSRIGANLYYEQCAANQDFTMGYVHAAHYSYDVTGNVQTLVRDIPELESMGQRYKRVDYEYDLLSGKVNMLAYNRGGSDQFYHRYAYDADNRITQVETSGDGVIWKRDAGYTYYKHGPLARVSLGDQRVQGIDYAYTLQGWLKSINGDAADTAADMGRDGRMAYGITPKDVFATSIDYFDGDYAPIGQVPVTGLPATPKNLYNGNIARQTTDVSPFGALTTAYTYDQLNRIRYARYAKRDPNNTLQFNNRFASSYRYDQDGNLRALTRRDSAGVLMDNFSYYYPNSGMNNRLGDVLDSASFNKPGVEDIKPYLPSSPGLVRFQYDEDGNVIKDMTSGTDSVQWNIYGKATDIENRINKSKLHFVYDGAGQRVSKNQTITADSGYQYRNTYYVRDASGNILAEYKSRQEYKRRELRVTGWADIAVDIDPLITSIHEMGYDVDPAFKGSATTSGGGMSISYTPGHYLSSDAVLLQQVVSNNTDTLLKDLCTYGSSTNRYPAGDATMLSIGAGNEYQLTQLSQALFAEADAPTRSHALVQLAISMPDLYRELMSDLSIDTVSTPEDSTHIAEYMRSTNDSDPAYFPSKIEGYYISGVANPGVPNPVHRWVQLATADPLYYEGLFQEQGIVSMLSDNLVGYGLEAAALAAETNATQVADEGLFGFMNGLSSAMDMILDHVSPGDLEQIEYDNDPPAYLRSLAQYAGASALDNALHAMGSTVEIAALYDRIVNNIRPGTTAGDMPSLDDGTPVLQLRQLDLSAHHLYGSSRLGIANYWPGQYSRIWNYTTKVVDTFRLGSGRPWYSGAYNDVIEREKTSPYGFGLQSPTLAQHVLGQKQYELSNHLGNVQATVSDARYVTGSGAGLKFKNSIVAAYDYYPFGMLMPDRFVTDTGQRSATVTQVVLAPKLVNTPVDMNVGVPDDSLYITWFPTIRYASGYGGNIHWTSSVVPQEPVEVTVDLRYVFGYTTVRVSEYVNGVWQIRANGFANYPGPVTLSGFTPTTNQIRISIGTDVMYVNSQVLFTLYSIGVSRMTMVPQLMATTIHNVDRDRYAFGFNGQLKDNEVAGLGNHLEFRFRGYDSRLGRFWSADPLTKDYPWNSTYAFAENRVIDGMDLEGAERYWSADGSYLGKYGESKDIMVVKDKVIAAQAQAALKDNKLQKSDFFTKTLPGASIRGYENTEANRKNVMNSWAKKN